MVAHFFVPRIHRPGKWRNSLDQRVTLEENGAGVVVRDGLLVTRGSTASGHYQKHCRGGGSSGDRSQTTAAGLRESIEREQGEGAEQKPLKLSGEVFAG